MDAQNTSTPFVHTEEKSTGITWKQSTPPAGQVKFLMSYAVNPGGKEGIYGAFKIVGIYSDDKAADAAMTVESKEDFNKQYKIGNVGKWDLLKDPMRLKADELDKLVDIKGKDGEMVRTIIATQNAKFKQQEDRDKKEMKEREERILNEMTEDIEGTSEEENSKKKEKEKYLHYKIVNEKLKQNPLFIESAKQQIEELQKEIKRIEERNVAATAELKSLDEKHPEFRERYKKDEEIRLKKKQDELKKRAAKK